MGGILALALSGLLLWTGLLFAEDGQGTGEGTHPKQVAVDNNKDGEPDSWQFYENGQVARTEADRNFDGQVDEWGYFENGKPTKAESDTDGDGKADQWVTY